MKVLIRPRLDPSGVGKFQVEIRDDALVSDLKAKLEELLKVRSDKQTLLHDQCGTTVLLNDTCTLKSYQLHENSTIYLEITKEERKGNLKGGVVYSPEVVKKIYDMYTSNQSPFHIALDAVKRGDVTELSKLIEVDNNILDDEDTLLNQSETNKYSLLHFACYFDKPEIVALLVSKQVKCNAESMNFWTPLQIASYRGHADCVYELLQHTGIQINKMTVFRGTALHLACKAGHVEIVKLLLDNGASMVLEDYKGRIPLQRTTNSEIAELIAKYMGELQLKKYGVNVEAPSIFCSKVYMIGTLTISDARVFLYLDPQAGELRRYHSRDEFVNKNMPEAVHKLIDIVDVNLKKCWVYNKFGGYYFEVDDKSSVTKYYTKHEEYTKEWITRILEAVSYCQLHGIGKLKGYEKRRSVTSAHSLQNSLAGPPNKFTSSVSGELHMRGNMGLKAASKPKPESVSGDAVDFNSFTIVEELGSGSFGTVYKVIKNDTQEIFAMKSLCKQKLLKQRQLKYAINECKVLRQLRHPYIVNLHFAFQNSKYLYMVLEFCPNGDLADLIERCGRLSEEVATFYMAETVLAIEHLHDGDIVYRDLKPSNILLDSDMHIRLADFGLAKEGVRIVDPNMTMAGSPAYIAPEMVARAGAGKTVDIYGLGVLLYQMITGITPYCSDNIQDLFHLITKGKLSFPVGVSDCAKECIKTLMHTNPSKRPNIAQVKRLNFFKNINWEMLADKRVQPPIEALSSNIEDINEFNTI